MHRTVTLLREGTSSWVEAVFAAVLGIALAMGGCSADPDLEAESTMREGVLIAGAGPLPGAIRGMHYLAGDQEGYTDRDGTFRYRVGEQVLFSLGALQFQPVDGAPAVSPFQLANGSGCAVGDALTRVLQILQSIDEDGMPDNGLQLPELAVPAELRGVDALDATGLEAAILEIRADAVVIAPDIALDRFIRLVDDEAWEEGSVDAFGLPELVARTQGVATDGSSWFFSSSNHLQRTNLSYAPLVENAMPIPDAIRVLGGNHIGDIDYHDGLLYAPIEDGSDYLHPYVVTYDAKTLEPTGTTYLLEQTVQTEGVPWVAIDGPRQVAYSAEWDPVERINVYDLNDNLKLLRSIELITPVGRIQGAKVFGGAMYASSDNEDKSIYKIDLDTGIVMKLFALGTPDSEVEGLALIGRADAVRMRILNIVLPEVIFEARVRTRRPVRDRFCP